MQPEHTERLEVLFRDYQELAKSHSRLQFKVGSIEDVLSECCSTEDLIERAIAHKTLYSLVERIDNITDKIVKVEKTQSLDAVNLGKIKAMEKDLEKFKIYTAMVVGAVTALEVFGVIDRIKNMLS